METVQKVLIPPGGGLVEDAGVNAAGWRASSIGLLTLLWAACAELAGIDDHLRSKPEGPLAGGTAGTSNAETGNAGTLGEGGSLGTGTDNDASSGQGSVGSGGTHPDAPFNARPLAPDVEMTVVEGTQNNLKQLTASDAEFDRLVYAIVTQPTKGIATFTDEQGTVKYSSSTGAYGLDDFEYQVYDGHDEALAPGKVKVRVLPLVQPLRFEGSEERILGPDVDIDGNTAIIGSSHDSPNGGAAYLAGFQPDGSWKITQTLPVELPFDSFALRFGEFVGISGDWAVGSSAGFAFFYNRDAKGVFKPQLSTYDVELLHPDRFGTPPSIAGDWAAIGVRGDGDGETENSHAVCLYQHIRDLLWVRQDTLRSPSATQAATDGFGSHFELDGNRLIIGAPNDNRKATRAGACYVYELRGDKWEPPKDLVPPDGVEGQMGTYVALSGDTAFCSAPSAYNGQGAVYVFSVSTGVLQQELKAPASVTPNKFGRRVAIDGDTAVVMMLNQLPPGTGVESLGWVYRRKGTSWQEYRPLEVDSGPAELLEPGLGMNGTSIIITNGFQFNSAFVYNVPPPGVN